MRRWPERVYGQGEEPDPRFTFANERTFLAWIRTSLALLAAGIALDAFVEDVPGWVRTSSALLLVVFGSVCAVVAYFRWMAAETALRRREPLPAAGLLSALAYAVAGAGILGIVLVVAR
jgi:putative membrane protein